MTEHGRNAAFCDLMARAAASAEGSAFFFVISSNVVITAPPSLSVYSAARAETPNKKQSPRIG
ncbi:hypothetical protein AS032_34570 [Rhodococcus qingshengii]|nr:hypothetical protein EN35_32100 [Rhodococcus qingshengii]KSU59378.1 hypothetical protein AS032_34570 [Rhodococcus qingshengii]